MGPLYLQTERMDLREFTLDDAEKLLALNGDPEVMRFISDGAPTPMHEIRDEVLPKLMRDYRDRLGLGRWAEADRETDEFLGWFHLRPLDQDPSEFIEDRFPGEDKSAVWYSVTREEFEANSL